MRIVNTRIQNLRVVGLSSSTAVTDSYFNLVTMLLPGNGTNGAQNNTFLDSSTNNLTITRNGNATQGTFSPFSQTGWSNYFDGSGDYLQLADSTSWDLTGDFTIEMWIYKQSSTSQTFFQLGAGGSTTILLYQNASNAIIFLTSSAVITSSSSAALNQWNHVALVRSGGGSNNTKMYLNGQDVGQATNTTSFTGDAANGVRIGAEYPTGFEFAGYISNVRIVKGTAVYTSNFTVPTAPLTAITNTQLLTCQSNRFIDNSSNAFAITPNGNTSVQAFAPFNPTAAYAAATVGGSGYFDGTGDYLGIADSTVFDLNTTFTVEAWFYQPTAGDGIIFSRGGGSASWSTTNGHEYLLYISGGTFYWQFNSSASPSSLGGTAPAAGAWHHAAVGYNGTTTRLWLDGVSLGTSTAAYTLPTTRNITRVGYASSNQLNFTGYISNLRVVKGTDVYGVNNTTITLPTAPVTAIANTGFLLDYTNAGITDATAKNILETVADAQISTAQSKFGGSSMAFDGTGDYLMIPSSPNFVFGSGNFTIEFWLRLNVVNARQQIAYLGNGAGTNVPFLIELNTSFKLRFLIQTTAGQIYVDSSATPSANTWIHIACVRNGTSAYLFLDGVSQGTITPGANALVADNNPVYIGAGLNSPLNGYINDFRITKGYARYTTTFTPPTTAFPVQ